MAWRAPIILGGLFLSALTLSVASASTPGDGAYAPEPLDDSTIVDSLPEVAPPEVADPPNAAELEDLQHVATQQGITLEVAIERYAWRDNLALAVAQIRESAPDDFAGAEIVDANSAWIAFSDTASPEALNKLQVFLDSHPEISVEVRTGWGYTELELQTAIEIVHYTLLEQPDVIDVASTHEYTANQIVSTIVDDSDSGIPLDEYRNAAISALVDAGLGHLLDHIDISVRGSPVPFLGSDDSSSKHLGGESLSTCTLALPCEALVERL